MIQRPPLSAFVSFMLLVFLGLCHPAGAQSLRVLSFNAWAGYQEMDFQRLSLQIAKVRELDADIICLQEIFDARVKAAYQEAFPDYDLVFSDAKAPPSIAKSVVGGLFQSMSTLNRVHQRLFPSFAGTRAIFEGDAHGLAILMKRQKDRTLLMDSKTVHTYANKGSGRFSLAGLIDSLKPKAYLAVQYKVGDKAVWIFNTHWSNGVENPRRFRIAQELLSHIKAVQSPVILGMDSNADELEPEMLYLSLHGKDTYLETTSDMRAAPYQGKTWSAANTSTRGHLIEPDQRMDYVYTFDGAHHSFRTRRSAIVLDDEPFVSDHFGVLSEIELVPTPCESFL